MHLQEFEQSKKRDGIRSIGRWVGSAGIVAGLLAIAIPIAALRMLNEPTASGFDSPERVAYYRQLTAAFWAGIALGLAGIAMGWRLRPSRLGYAAIVLGSLGIAIGGFLLLTTVGLCGPWVLGGHCRP
jgi:hypothetical protein